jgi:cytochrome c
VLALSCGANLGGSSGSGGATSEIGDSGPALRPSVLVYSQTTGFRHDSIPVGVQALRALAEDRDWTLDATEDPSVFNDGELRNYNVLLFLSPTGENLNDPQKAAFERFIRSKKGYVGIHAASDTEYEWPFYGELVGAYFLDHPSVQRATIVVEDTSHPATAGLPARWTRTDEWYNFQTNPRANVEVLLSLDETSYDPGTGMDGDHPIAWLHEYEGTRVFYTALGHTKESYAEAAFLSHIARGIEWAARVE